MAGGKYHHFGVREGVICMGAEHIILISIILFVTHQLEHLLKKIKGHTGYYGCDNCTQRGLWTDHRMTFPERGATSRTDVAFHDMLYEDHQHGQSVLSQLNIGMITQFPLDYMHLVCLGIMKKMIHLWISGPLHVRIGNSMKANISDHILTLK